MSDAPSIDQSNINPSQTGDTAITLAPLPVNGTATPPAPAAEAVTTPEAPAAVTPPADTPSEPAQPKVDNVPSQAGEDGLVIYDATGDTGLDLALSFIGQLGIAGDDPVMVAAANGDFSLLEDKLSTFGDNAKGWEKHVQLGKEAFTRQLDAFKAEQAKTNAAVHAIAGGEANWKALVAWAGKNADPAEKAALNAMFDAGGFQAQAAARALVSAYQQAKGTTITPANPASNAAGVPAAAPKLMSAADYHKETEALYNKLGNRMDQSPEYADLRRRFFGR